MAYSTGRMTCVRSSLTARLRELWVPQWVSPHSTVWNGRASSCE